MRMVVFASAVIVASPAASAGEAVKPKIEALPGVKADYRIVKPAPEPLADAKPVVDDEGFALIGNTRVKISGLVRVDLDFDTRKTRRR